MDAYDLLPAQLRVIVSNAPYGCSARMVLHKLRQGMSEAELLRWIAMVRCMAEGDAIARGMPKGLAGWPPLKPRPRPRRPGR